MTDGQETDQRDESTDEIPFSRRDVMKAAGAATITGLTVTGTASATAQSECNCEGGFLDSASACLTEREGAGCSYCKIDSEYLPAVDTTCAIEGTDSATITRTSDDCITFSDPDGELCKIALKAGSGDRSCTVVDVGGVTSGEICTGNGKGISNIQFEYHCTDCPGDGGCEFDLDCEVKTETCEDVTVELSGSGVSTECPVDATLTFEESDCEPIVQEDITSTGDVTFEDIQGCCTPETVRFTPADDGLVLAQCDLEPTDGPCGYDDLQTSFGDTVNCDEIEVCVSGLECDVTAVLRTEGSDCPDPDLDYTFSTSNASTASVSEQTCHTFELGGCCTPTHVEFYTEGETEITGARLPESGDIDTGEDCGYDDVDLDVTDADCDEVDIEVTGVECPVTAELNATSLDSETCSDEPKTFTSDGTHTFTLGGCCRPDSVTLYPGEDTSGSELETEDVEISENCGYDDLEFSDVEFCCDEVSVDVSGIECDLEYEVTFSEGDCSETGTLTADDSGTVTLTWDGCCTPESVKLKTTDGELIATLEPDSPLNCVCDEEHYETCKFDVEDEPLPAKGQTKTFECDGVYVTVETTNENDGEPSCFKIVESSEPLFGVVVKGGPKENQFDLENDGCGTGPPAGPFCSNEVGNSGKPAAVSYWTITICTEDLTSECISGSVSYPTDS